MSGPIRAQALQLFVLRDGDLAASEVFGEGTYLIGTERDCDVVLDHASVTPVQLEFQEGRVRLSGAGGFHVNGRRVAEAEIGTADDVWLGPFLLKTRLMGRRKPASAGKSGKSHRSGGAALALVPEQQQPAVHLDPDDVDRLLSEALGEPEEPVVIGEEEAARLLTPLASLTLESDELADVLPLEFYDEAALEDLEIEEELELEPIPEDAEAPAPLPEDLALELAHEAHQGLPPRRSTPPLAQPIAAPRAAAPIAPQQSARATPPLQRAAAPIAPQPTARATPPLQRATAPIAPQPSARATPPLPRPAATAAPQPSARATPPLPRPAARVVPPPAARATPPAPQPAARPTPPAPRPAAQPTARPTVPIAAKPSARIEKPAQRPRAGAAPGLATASTAAALLHARIFWGDTLLFSRSYRPDAKAFADSADAAALQLSGFATLADAPLVRATGPLWSVQLPSGTRASFQRPSGGWAPTDESASRELRLSLGNAVRISNDRFHLELSAQAAPAQAHARFGRGVDLRLAALVLLLGAGLGIFLRTLPNVVPVHTLAPEQVRHVQLTIEKHEAPKRNKPKPPPDPAATVQKPPPPSIAQATNLKQAGVPLRSLDKITRATRGLSSLLASLTATAPTGGGKRDALAMLPSMGRAPAPLPGLGGTGGGGAAGPVTKGGELLRGGIGGLLAGATGGTGAVSGVPVSIPSRPTRVQGSIDRDLVFKVINEKIGEMRGCYERALLRDPNLGAGKVLLEWTIDGGGDVSEVRTKVATLKSSEVVSCLLDLLRTLKFPKPNGGVVIVSYPVLFNSVGY